VRICSVGVCGKKHKAKGLCAMHWSRAARGQPLVQTPEELALRRTGKKKLRLCSAPDCASKHFGRGLCKEHYQSWRKRQPDLIARSRARDAARKEAKRLWRAAWRAKNPERAKVETDRAWQRQKELWAERVRSGPVHVPEQTGVHYVYMWENLVNGKRYIGKGQGERAVRHLRDAQRGKGRLLAKALHKYGTASFRLTYLASGLSHEETLALEIRHIAEQNTVWPSGYNITKGGEGRQGPFSDETRARMSLAQKAVRARKQSLQLSLQK